MKHTCLFVAKSEDKNLQRQGLFQSMDILLSNYGLLQGQTKSDPLE